MEGFIRCEEIIAECNFRLGKVKNLSIRECIGFHTVVHIEAEIEAGSLDLTMQQFNSQPLKISAMKEGKKIQLFSGVISKVRMEGESAYETLYMEAYSFSWLMDLEKKNRSFQGETSILNLIQKISEENSFSLVGSPEDKVAKAPFIQYRETDWELLKRISSHLHVPVYPAGDQEGRKIYLGLQQQRTPVVLSALNEKWRMSPERLKQVDFDMRKAVYYEIETSQILHLGQSVRYHNEILWIFAVDMILQQGMLHCSYQLAGAEYHIIPSHYNPYMKGVSLTGIVLERKNESIKVHLDMDEEQEIDKAYYYTWLPEHGNILYCMPEEGSRVRLFVAGEDERNAIGIQCVRQNGEVCQETQISNNRWFATDQKKKMTLQPTIIELSGEEGKSGITLEDQSGNNVRSCGDVLIQAKGNIVMQGTTVNLSAPDEITAIKREMSDPAIVNICHNLDAMGKKTIFRNLPELQIRNTSKEGQDYSEKALVSEKVKAEEEEKKKKIHFEIQELFRQEGENGRYELGACVVNIISAIPQPIIQDKISQIAMGFRPIMGLGKDEK